MKHVLKIKQLDKDLPPARYSSDGAVGIDLFAVEDVEVEDNATVRTGVSVEIPRGFVGIVFGRSGFAFKEDIDAFNGVIDPDYRGEIAVKLRNFTSIVDFEEPFIIRRGDRVAQLLVIPAPRWDIQCVDELTPTNRGTNGFGSTGR